MNTSAIRFILICLLSFLVSCSSTNTNSSQAKLAEAISDLNSANQTVIRERLKAFCKNGQRAACVRLAELAAKDMNFDESFSFYQKACGLGELVSCSKLGEILFQQNKLKEARVYLEKAQHNDYITQVRLALLNYTEKKSKVAKTQFEKLCSINLITACFYRGVIAETERDLLTAQKYYSIIEKNTDFAASYFALIQLQLGNRSVAEKLIEDDARSGEQSKMVRIWEMIVLTKNDPSTEKSLTTKCEKKDKEACYTLGLILSLNSKTYEKGIKLFRQSCDLGNGFGCLELANMLNIAPASSPERMKYIQKACELGSGPACNLVHSDRTLAYDNNVSPDLLKKACELKNNNGCYSYATHLWYTNKKSDALLKYRESCDLNLQKGCYWFEYLSVNTEDRKEVMTKFCNAGLVEACNEAADVAYDKNDIDLARSYYSRACKLKDMNACVAELNFADKTYVNLENEIRIAKYCDLKNSYACYLSGKSLYSGKQYKEAKKLLIEGCMLNNPNACEYLGYTYEALGDKTSSIEMLQKSCDLGSGTACGQM